MVISEYCHGSPRGLLARIPLRSPSQRYPQRALPRSLYPQGGLQSFCSAEYGTTLRVWNRHQSLLHLREISLVSNMRTLPYESCVE